MSDSGEYMPTLEEVRRNFAFSKAGDRIHRTQEYFDAFDHFLAAYTAKVQADALRELAAHFNEPGITATSAGSIYIYESREHYDAGRPRPTEIVSWLRDRADSLWPVNDEKEGDE